MADLPNPSSVKRSLPFKRTVRQNSANLDSAADEDGIALFSQSKTYFPAVIEDQKRRAREKAEQERLEKLAREKEEEERAARRERKARKQEEKERIAQELLQAKREQREKEREERRKEKEKEKEKEKKRSRRSGLLVSDDDDEDDDGASPDRPRKAAKPSIPLSPESRVNDTEATSPEASGSKHASRSRVKIENTLVLLDSSDNEGPTKKELRSSTKSSAKAGEGQSQSPRQGLKQDMARADISDSDIEMSETRGEDEGNDSNDPLQPYVQAAMERMRKAKEAAERAREAAAAGGGNSQGTSAAAAAIEEDRSPTVSVMIVAPAWPDSKALCCTVRTSQALQIAFDTFKERQKVHSKYPHKLISELVFTWRGDRVYNTTKLETLGIRPLGQDGRLYEKRSGRGPPEGYLGKDKVFFEACTQDEYEENQQKRERERKRRENGEFWSEDEDMDDGTGTAGPGESAADDAEMQNDGDRVKVIFKARDMPPRNITLRKSSTVAQMIKAFRKLAGLGEDKKIEIRWDGEVLGADTTVEEADIGDLDSVEVHIR